MPRAFLAAALAVASVLFAGSCSDKPQGSTRVLVIGAAAPQMRDLAAGPLAAPDAVLMANAAQGLVRFDATGQIVPGLAERWNVSDDGLTYIFRIATTNWPDGKKVTAQQVARILKRLVATSSNDPLKDTLGAVGDIVAMTDRVVDIELRAPRPNLLEILAQPEFAIARDGAGTGPFAVAGGTAAGGDLRLVREQAADGDEEGTARREEVLLGGANIVQAINTFGGGKADIVLGGTFADLPYPLSRKQTAQALQFDPASGLFGLVPVRSGGLLDNVEVRQLLSQAIDRGALVDALHVPGLAARATLLEPNLDGMPTVAQPAWFGTVLSDRRSAIAATAARLLPTGDPKPTLRVFLPEGPGARMLLNRLTADWGAVGILVEPAPDLKSADLALVDEVAPSTSAAWFLRRFRCDQVPVCDAAADQLLDAARQTAVPAQRYALLGQAAAAMDNAQLFIPLAAPVRWSLVAERVTGFAGNRYARHTLTDLEQRLNPGGN
ncbi:ABC transporter substrate-binding protein [Sphingomonas sp.]|uniref:ABC transporter substrate-binding protein n=1 Tax=Sphingomonas sp. TaxID=28214 RepID=UPI0025FDBA6E|nr:ABC transporter substrate-binding protein [Sphingomonas sp.]MBV9528401.1 ABC transporter substrate-binding protein [Sphingomonas sp.]